ncbi:hypothetical protein E0485_14540 [Paenibacillus albiflavus]|uniref:Uncharacterized protein n=1 Tax=Paenibacillus albiflavus TaxID=2545760 RepID=A0A4R4ED27_9BACL|nr:hypothetical protein [Paenibacillus albiflavus]TCZ76061.1 hypothetical protein E0485_14540 [Paenibacillus albiflavus]
MGIVKDFWDIVVKGEEQQVIDRNIVAFRLKPHEMYKLDMICDELNDRLGLNGTITPNSIARRVVRKFLRQCYDENTEQIVSNLLPTYIEQFKRIEPPADNGWYRLK